MQWVVVIRTAREIYAGMKLLVFTLWKSLDLIELIEPPAVPTSPAGPAYEDLGPTPAPHLNSQDWPVRVPTQVPKG